MAALASGETLRADDFACGISCFVCCPSATGEAVWLAPLARWCRAEPKPATRISTHRAIAAAEATLIHEAPATTDGHSSARRRSSRHGSNMTRSKPGEVPLAMSAAIAGRSETSSGDWNIASGEITVCCSGGEPAPATTQFRRDRRVGEVKVRERPGVPISMSSARL